MIETSVAFAIHLRKSMIVLRTSFRVKLTLNCFCIVVHDRAVVIPHDVSMADSQMTVGCSGEAVRDIEASN